MAVLALCFDRFTSVKKAPVPIERQPGPVLTFFGEEKNPLSLSEI
jgi:hypothetical protein